MSLSQLTCGQSGVVPTLILCAPKEPFGMRKEQKNPVKILSHSLYAKRVTKFSKKLASIVVHLVTINFRVKEWHPLTEHFHAIKFSTIFFAVFRKNNSANKISPIRIPCAIVHSLPSA